MYKLTVFFLWWSLCNSELGGPHDRTACGMAFIDIYSLERRRLRGDLIGTFKILTGRKRIDSSSKIILRTVRNYKWTMRACIGGAVGSVAVRAAWLWWSASLGSRPSLARSLYQVIVAYALKLNSRTGTEGSTVSSLISISRCLNHS